MKNWLGGRIWTASAAQRAAGIIAYDEAGNVLKIEGGKLAARNKAGQLVARRHLFAFARAAGLKPERKGRKGMLIEL
jgi:hypothetical protein